VNARSPKNDRKKSDSPTESPAAHDAADVRNVSFPHSVRGYDRGAVDAYVHRVNRVIAELEISRSPQAAVRHAVDRVSEQTKEILQQARESAEKLTDTAREEAAEIIATAKAEAANLVVSASTEADRLGAEAEQVMARAQAQAAKTLADAQAEATEHLRRTDEEIASLQEQANARLRELEADTESVRAERRGLLGDMNEMASQLQEAASAAATRFSAGPPDDEAPSWPSQNDAEPTAVLPPEAAERP